MAEVIILERMSRQRKLEEYVVPGKMICKKCKAEKSKEEFAVSPSCRYGRRRVCRSCEKEQVKANQEAKQVDKTKYFDF